MMSRASQIKGKVTPIQKLGKLGYPQNLTAASVESLTRLFNLK
jgi:hypothetical protein